MVEQALCLPPGKGATGSAFAGGSAAERADSTVAAGGGAPALTSSAILIETMNCDSIARWYRWLEYGAFGGELQRRRVAFLGEMAPAQTALVLGDGDGRFLAELLRAIPSVQVDAVDASAAMIALARERTGSGRVRFHCEDARELPFAPGAYNLLVTHFFLDCFSDAELAGLIPRLAAASTAEARWVVSEFTPCRGKPGAGLDRGAVPSLWLDNRPAGAAPAGLRGGAAGGGICAGEGGVRRRAAVDLATLATHVDAPSAGRGGTGSGAAV